MKVASAPVPTDTPHTRLCRLEWRLRERNCRELPRHSSEKDGCVHVSLAYGEKRNTDANMSTEDSSHVVLFHLMDERYHSGPVARAESPILSNTAPITVVLLQRHSSLLSA